MKRLFLTLTFAVLAAALFAQSYTVIDTVVDRDMKHLVVNDRLYGQNGLVQVIKRLADSEKIINDSITYRQSTIQFIQSIKANYDSLTVSHYKFKELQYDSINGDYFLNGDTINSIGLIDEYQQLSQRVQQLNNDPEINDVTSNPEFIAIKTRQAAMLKVYKQIQAQW